MRRVLATAVLGVVAMACSSKTAGPDASACGEVKQVDCDVTVTCNMVDSHAHVSLCEKSNDATTIEQMAKDQVAPTTSCTTGATFAATCTAPPGAITCPMGFELEDVTVCLPGMTYDASTADVCDHLPATDDPCGHACDRAALYQFVIDGKFSTYTCATTNGVQFIVGVTPMTGDGSRQP